MTEALRTKGSQRSPRDIRLVSEIARIRVAIEREQSAADRLLSDHPSTAWGREPRWRLTEYRELRRQLAALRKSVSKAPARSEGDPALLRADLATLMSFAKTLRSDAKNWRAGLEEGLREIARQDAAAQRERARLAAERTASIRHRDKLQAEIDETAKRMARDSGADYRRVFPCFAFGEALTVCSLKVAVPGSGLRREKRWLVTLNDSQDQVVVRRAYV